MVLLSAMLVMSLTACDSGPKKPEEKAEEKAIDIQEGEMSGDTYTNDSLGFKMDIPKGWAMASEEEMLQVIQMGAELVNNDEYTDLADAFEKGLIEGYPLFIASEDALSKVNNSTSSIQVTVERGDVDAEAFSEALKQYLESLTMIDYEVSDSEELTINGNTFYKTVATATPMGVDLSQAYYAYKLDGYILLVTTTVIDPDIEEEIEKAVMSIEIK